jgi:MFS transporter, SP family, general alpha glucoside:H+ symporter
LTSQNDEGFDPAKTIAMMIHTDELEKELSAGTHYLDCFRGIDLRRTEIACVVWMIQTLCGSGLQGYSTQFYEQAGIKTVFAFDFNMGQYALGALGTFLSWFLMTRIGRRTLYFWGLVAACVALLIIGFVGIAPKSNTTAPWVIGSMLLIFTFIYDATIGPVCYCLVAEISSTRLRSKTIVLARNFYNVVGIFNNIITPRMINPTAWNWGAKAGFFWAGSCFLCIVWTYFRLPEPKGKTYAELDVLFERGLGARKFKNAKVDPFRSDSVHVGHDDIAQAKLQQSEDEKVVVMLNEKV